MKRFQQRMMSLLSWVASTRAGESKVVLLLCACAFFKGLSVLYLETVASALFIGSLAIETLPYVYLFIAILTLAAGFLYAYSEKKLRAVVLIVSVHGVLATILLAFYFGMGFIDKKPLSFFIMVWKDVSFIFIEITFWATAGFLLTLEQSKRLFGLLIASEVLADILGGFTMPFLTPILTINQLILLAFYAFVASTILLIIILLRLNPETEEPDPPASLPAETYWSDNYLRMLTLFSILSVFAYYFIDYIFYDIVAEKFTEEADAAAFFGVYFGALGVINFFVSLFLSGRLLIHWGIGFGILAPPLVMFFGTSLVGTSLMYTSLAGLVFSAIVILKVTYDIAIYTIEAPTRKVMYIPIRIGHRLQIQGTLESIIEPVACGVAAGILILLTTTLSLSFMHLVIVLFVTVLAWFVNGLFLHRAYRDLLQTNEIRANACRTHG